MTPKGSLQVGTWEDASTYLRALKMTDSQPAAAYRQTTNGRALTGRTSTTEFLGSLA